MEMKDNSAIEYSAGHQDHTQRDARNAEKKESSSGDREREENISFILHCLCDDDLHIHERDCAKRIANRSTPSVQDMYKLDDTGPFFVYVHSSNSDTPLRAETLRGLLNTKIPSTKEDIIKLTERSNVVEIELREGYQANDLLFQPVFSQHNMKVYIPFFVKKSRGYIKNVGIRLSDRDILKDLWSSKKAIICKRFVKEYQIGCRIFYEKLKTCLITFESEIPPRYVTINGGIFHVFEQKPGWCNEYPTYLKDHCYRCGQVKIECVCIVEAITKGKRRPIQVCKHEDDSLGMCSSLYNRMRNLPIAENLLHKSGTEPYVPYMNEKHSIMLPQNQPIPTSATPNPVDLSHPFRQRRFEQKESINPSASFAQFAHNPTNATRIPFCGDNRKQRNLSSTHAGTDAPLTSVDYAVRNQMHCPPMPFPRATDNRNYLYSTPSAQVAHNQFNVPPMYNAGGRLKVHRASPAAFTRPTYIQTDVPSVYPEGAQRRKERDAPSMFVHSIPSHNYAHRMRFPGTVPRPRYESSTSFAHTAPFQTYAPRFSFPGTVPRQQDIYAPSTSFVHSAPNQAYVPTLYFSNSVSKNRDMLPTYFAHPPPHYNYAPTQAAPNRNDEPRLSAGGAYSKDDVPSMHVD